MSEEKLYGHKNGYSARLYSKTSMSVYFKGKEVAHTGLRNVNTEDEVMDMLDKYPELMKSLREVDGINGL